MNLKMVSKYRELAHIKDRTKKLKPLRMLSYQEHRLTTCKYRNNQLNNYNYVENVIIFNNGPTCSSCQEIDVTHTKTADIFLLIRSFFFTKVRLPDVPV